MPIEKLREELHNETILSVGRARNSLLAFCKHQVPNFHINWHHRVICSAVDRMRTGSERRVIISAPPRHGKALSVETPIATPDGFVAMGDLRVGDTVFDERGHPTKIIAATCAEPDRPVLLVRAKDGAEVVADAEHMWVARLDRKIKKQAYRTTAQLFERQKLRSWRAPAIALQGPLSLPSRSLPIDPYLLGVWLGDGDSGQATITKCQAEQPFFRQLFEAAGYATTDRSDGKSFGVTKGFWEALKKLNLLGNKHIPDAYLFADLNQRQSLLQGLIDTDGYVASDGQVEFSSIRRHLADGVRFLVASLGQKASLHEGDAKIDGRYICRYWRVMFYYKHAATLPRKRDKLRSSVKFNHRYIRISEAGRATTRCIQVAAASGMFLAGHGLLPTHNSEIISRLLPGYILGHSPTSNIIACSYAADLAKRMNRDAQRLIDCDSYKQVFPDTQLNSKNVRTVAQTSYLRNSDIFEVVEYKGTYRASGVGGGITGMGADWLLCDDLVANAEQGGSQTILDAQWEWYTSTARTRLAKDGRILIVMTRWADGDIPGRLIELAREDKDADQWTVINLPAINEDGPSDIDPREPGEALWPHMFPLETLRPIKATNARVWQSLYQGDPVPPGGNIVQASWWRRWTEAELPLRFDQVMFACDLTFKDGNKSDWTVFAVMAKKNGRAYLLDQVRRKMNFLDQIDQLQALRQKWIDAGHHVREVAVEAAANGEALVSTLRGHIPNIIAVPTGRSSKLARAAAQTPIIQAGNLLIPTERERPWVADYTIEWQRFPHGKNDDQVDATVLGLARLFPASRATSIAMPVSIRKRKDGWSYQ